VRFRRRVPVLEDLRRLGERQERAARAKLHPRTRLAIAGMGFKGDPGPNPRAAATHKESESK
jgi:hypothetical protein